MNKINSLIAFIIICAAGCGIARVADNSLNDKNSAYNMQIAAAKAQDTKIMQARQAYCERTQWDDVEACMQQLHEQAVQALQRQTAP
jgi:hypothetical protein